VQLIVDALLAAHQEALDSAVENGRLAQEQADAMQDNMAEEIAEHVNEPWTGRMERGLMGHPGGRKPPEDMAGGRGAFGIRSSSLLDITAERLGLTVDEVVDELSAGISIADLAAAHSVDVQLIVDAYLAAHQEALSTAVENGRLTQEQADAMQETMAEEVAERVNEPWTGKMAPSPMGRWDGRGVIGMGGSSLLDIAAGQLGLTVDEVVDELSAGISIADLAANHNVDVQLIVDAYLAARQEALSTAVENGRLTQEQADAIQEHMAEEIAGYVNEPWTGSYGPHGGFRGGCPDGGMGGRWNESGTNGGAAPMRGLSTGSSL
jgi:uncharacterized protein (DUF433 family)